MTTDSDEETDEVIEGYIQHYRLDDELPKRQKKQALYLISCVRKLRRFSFADRKLANNAHASACRGLAESQVFHAYEHAGYNELLAFVSDSLEKIRLQIDERFPA